MKKRSVPTINFVEHLPDLIVAEDYLDAPDVKKIRLRIRVTDEGVELLGDSMYAYMLEEVLVQLGAEEFDRMLCG